MFLQVPDNARSVATRRHRLTVVLADLDRPHSAAVFLERHLHHLRLLGYPPDPDFPLCAPRNYAFAVGGGGDCRAAVVVSVVDDVEEFSGLGQKGPDFAVRPARNNALAIIGKGNREALQTRNLYPQQLLPILSIPYPDLIRRSRSKHLRVVMRKRDIVDPFVVASVSQLGQQSCRIYPVDVRLGGPCEEVGVVARERHRSHVTHHFALG